MSTTLAKQDKNNARKTLQKRTPRYEVFKENDSYYLEVYVPGVKSSEVNVDLNGKDLSISTFRELSENHEHRLISQEFTSSDYELNLKLNTQIDPEKISATVNNGVLKLLLPLAEEVKPRKIQIS